MRIIFWGSPAFALPCLQCLVESPHEVVAIVTQPDRRQGRKKKIVPSEIKKYATEQGITVLQPETPNTSEFVATLSDLQPDVMIVAAYGKILRKKVLAVSPAGYINVHFSILPKYRGASPVTANILSGDKETGVTIMRMVREMDAGPILLQKSIPIGPEDTTGSLQWQLSELSQPLLLETLEKIVGGKFEEKEQNHEEATFCSLIAKKDGEIDWSKDAAYIERFLRAMQPWPTAFTFLARQDKKEPERLIIHKAEVLNKNSTGTPGSIVQVDNKTLEVATGDGVLAIHKIQRAGRPVLSTEEFLRGFAIQQGDTFCGLKQPEES